jgi:hypothetical protein
VYIEARDGEQIGTVQKALVKFTLSDISARMVGISISRCNDRDGRKWSGLTISRQIRKMCGRFPVLVVWNGCAPFLRPT